MVDTRNRLFVLMLLFIVVSWSTADRELSHKRRAFKLDCTRFVYAPLCRGVAAKRFVSEILNINEEIPEMENVDYATDLKSLISILRNRDSPTRKWSIESSKFPFLHFLEDNKEIQRNYEQEDRTKGDEARFLYK